MRYKYKISVHGYVVGFIETDQPLEKTGVGVLETDEVTLRTEPGVKVVLVEDETTEAGA